MTQLYPLVFSPVFKERVWGGRRLGRWFPELPEGPIGEAWVLSDHPQGRTSVANGPLKGETIQSLKERFGAALLGTRGIHPKTGEFPLLFKLLDSQDDLSVQVHPSDGYPGLPPGELGKTEMWVILDAEPGAKVVYGLADGVTPESLATAVREGRTMEAMRELVVRPGDVLYVPAGVVHALGTGLLVAEIQQSSDTTYRVYDYDRRGLDGKPRELHVEHALAVASYDAPPAPSHPTVGGPNQWQTVVASPFFVTDQGQCEGVWEQETDPATCEALMILEGQGSITWEGGAESGADEAEELVRSEEPGTDEAESRLGGCEPRTDVAERRVGGEERLAAGMTLLVPACLGRYRLTGSMRALRVRMP